MKNYQEDQVFEHIDYREIALAKGEYERCHFLNCSFAHADLAEIIFVECVFEECDLSMVNLRNTSFRDTEFDQCKLLGLRFDECNPFLLSVTFRSSVLNFSSFFKLKLKKTHFSDCKLIDVEFVESDFSQSTFSSCDLAGAVFENTLLEGVDFRTAHNFTIDPEKNRIKKARFSLSGLPGLLDRYKLLID